MLSKEIADALEKADPDHKDIYQENASAYSEKLKDLDAKYQEVVDGASQKTLPFGDVWAEYCEECGAPKDGTWFGEIEKYEETVLTKRV